MRLGCFQALRQAWRSLDCGEAEALEEGEEEGRSQDGDAHHKPDRPQQGLEREKGSIEWRPGERSQRDAEGHLKARRGLGLTTLTALRWATARREARHVGTRLIEGSGANLNGVLKVS